MKRIWLKVIKYLLIVLIVVLVLFTIGYFTGINKVLVSKINVWVANWGVVGPKTIKTLGCSDINVLAMKYKLPVDTMEKNVCTALCKQDNLAYHHDECVDNEFLCYCSK